MDIPLSETERQLSILSEYGFLQLRILFVLRARPLHGFGIIKQLHQSYSWRPNHATIYPLLRAFERRGFIRSTRGLLKSSSRRLYSITKAGTEIVDAYVGPLFRRCTIESLVTKDLTPEKFIEDLKIRNGERILYVFSRPWALEPLSRKNEPDTKYVLLPLSQVSCSGAVSLPLDLTFIRSLTDIEDGLNLDRIISTNAFSPYEAIIDPTIRILEPEESLRVWRKVLRAGGELDIVETAKHAVYEMYLRALLSGFSGGGLELEGLRIQLTSAGFHVEEETERNGFITLKARRTN